MKKIPSIIIILELLVIFASNIFLHAIIQYIIRAQDYFSYLFLLIPIFSSVVFGFWVSLPKNFDWNKKLKPIFNALLALSGYILVIFHLMTPLELHGPPRFFPFIVLNIFVFLLFCCCVLSFNAQSQYFAVNDASVMVLILIFIVFMGLMQLFNQFIIYFAISSIFHTLYIIFLKIFENPAQINKEKILEMQGTMKNRMLTNIFLFLFLILAIYNSMYAIAFEQHMFMTYGLLGRIDSVKSLWASSFLLVGFISSMYIAKIITNRKSNANFYDYISIVLIFAASILGNMLNASIGFFALGYLLGFLLIWLMNRNGKVLNVLLSILLLIFLTGYYILFDYPIFDGLFAQGIAYDFTINSMILTVSFFAVCLIELVGYIRNSSKNKKELN